MAKTNYSTYIAIKNRVLALTEFGGYSMPLAGHMAGAKEFGYRIYRDKESFMDAYCALFEKEIIPCMEKQALSATDEARVRRINDRLKF